jgi:hypothetical protein
VKEIQTVLFLPKLPPYIRKLTNSREFQEPEALIQRCNEITKSGRIRALKRLPPPGGSALPSRVPAAPPLHSAGRGPRRQVWPPPLNNPQPARGGGSDCWCFYHSRFGSKAKKCKKGCSYQEN